MSDLQRLRDAFPGLVWTPPGRDYIGSASADPLGEPPAKWRLVVEADLSGYVLEGSRAPDSRFFGVAPLGPDPIAKLRTIIQAEGMRLAKEADALAETARLLKVDATKGDAMSDLYGRLGKALGLKGELWIGWSSPACWALREDGWPVHLFVGTPSTSRIPQTVVPALLSHPRMRLARWALGHILKVVEQEPEAATPWSRADPRDTLEPGQLLVIVDNDGNAAVSQMGGRFEGERLAVLGMPPLDEFDFGGAILDHQEWPGWWWIAGPPEDTERAGLVPPKAGDTIRIESETWSGDLKVTESSTAPDGTTAIKGSRLDRPTMSALMRAGGPTLALFGGVVFLPDGTATIEVVGAMDPETIAWLDVSLSDCDVLCIRTVASDHHGYVLSGYTRETVSPTAERLTVSLKRIVLAAKTP